jgi:RNA recognition motif-containing protein
LHFGLNFNYLLNSSLFVFQIFCGRIPKVVLEDELIPMFEEYGPVSDMRIMMNPMTNRSRGFAFVKFVNRSDGMNAVRSVRHWKPAAWKLEVCSYSIELFC